MMDSDPIYEFYQRIIGTCQTPGGGGVRSWGCWLVERLMRLAVIVQSRRLAVRFPRRAVGSSWWIARWRFEFLMGWNERESVACCQKLIKPGMTVVDIGAHLGYYTRLFSQLVGSTGKVLAFEPCPENYPLLKHNLSARQYSNVQLFDCAISDQSGRVPLYLSPGHSNHSLLPGYTETQGILEVESISLDAFLSQQGIQRLDFIKVDVEGAEPLVLAGMRQTVAHSPQLAMLIECNPQALRCGGVAPEELILRLRQMGFAVQAIRPDGTLAQVSDRAGHADEVVNLLCRVIAQPA